MIQYKKTPLSEVVASANGGNTQAKASLGILNELGLLKNAEINEALKWFEDAAKAGDPLSAISAAEIYRTGRDGVQKNLKKAEEYYKVAESLGYSRPEKRVPKPEKVDMMAQDVLVGKKIIVLDKPGKDAEDMKTHFNEAGFKTTIIHDVISLKKALTISKDIDCFFVELDLGTPNQMQSLDVIRKMKTYRRTPIVIVTTITDVNVITKAKAYRINGWVLKPVKKEVIVTTAQKSIAQNPET